MRIVNMDQPSRPRWQYTITGDNGIKTVFQFAEYGRAKDLRALSVSARGERNVTDVEEILE